MRRKDKEITDRTVIESIIKNSKVCRLGISSNNNPCVVPLCFGYKDNTLYFHSAPRGKKIDILKKNPNVCIEFETDTKVIESDKACDWDVI